MQSPTHCSRPMRLIKGKYGKSDFYSCANYPKCKHTQSILVEKQIEIKPGSEEQDAFWQFLLNKKHHGILRARAGTGKTWSSVQACARLDSGGNYIFVAYNKKNATELAERLPSYVTACTVHSFGNKALTAAFGFKRADEDKTINILKDHADFGYEYDMGAEGADMIARAVKDLVSKCKNMLLKTDDDTLYQISMGFGINILEGSEAKVFDLARYVLDVSKSPRGINRYSIDFDDMVWLPIVLNLPVPQYDIAFVDEAQDSNASRRMLMLKSVGMGLTGRLIVVGDDRQSMYRWNGADGAAIDEFFNALVTTPAGVKDLPLTINWRCGKSHIRMAQKLVPDIRYHDDAPEGSIEIATDQEFEDQVQVGDMALCRKNAPLIKYAYLLLRRGVPVVIQGRDFQKQIKQLVSMLGRLNGSKRSTKNESAYRTMPDFYNRLSKYFETERGRIIGKYKDPASALDQLSDKVQTVEALAEGKESVAEIIEAIDTLFKDLDGAGKGVVTLSSVHRSKGFEAPRVWILRPDFLPMSWKGMTAEQHEEELNILYVAVTRVLAREDIPGSGRLIFVGDIPREVL